MLALFLFEMVEEKAGKEINEEKKEVEEKEE